ncbi:hypothetical protein TNCV_2748021 [Trichonephila clavipes]|nr:hypothetical protein TNCV_2748021 [Trichonephila clavipes]
MIAGAEGAFSSEGWENKVNHDVMTDLIKKSPTTKRGRTDPKARNALRSRAPAGRGEERRKESGTAKGRIRCMLVVRNSLSIMQVTIQFGLVPPQFRGRTSGGGQRHPNSLPLPPTLRENLRLDDYSE